MFDEKLLGRYIDYLRKTKKMKREDLVEDIVSLRQFKRYVAGEIAIPNKILTKLSKRLSMAISKIFESFVLSSKAEELWYEDIIEVGRQDYKLFLKRYENERRDYVISREHKLDLERAKVDIELLLESITVEQHIQRLEKLLQYPEITKKEYLTPAELVGFISLCTSKLALDSSDVIFEEHLELMERDAYPDDNLNLKLYVLASAAHRLFELKQYESVIEYAHRAILLAGNNDSLVEMMRCHFLMSLTYNKLNNEELAKQYFDKGCLYAMMNPKQENGQYKEFLELFKDSFGWVPTVEIPMIVE